MFVERRKEGKEGERRKKEEVERKEGGAGPRQTSTPAHTCSGQLHLWPQVAFSGSLGTTPSPAGQSDTDLPVPEDQALGRMVELSRQRLEPEDPPLSQRATRSLVSARVSQTPPLTCKRGCQHGFPHSATLRASRPGFGCSALGGDTRDVLRREAAVVVTGSIPVLGLATA